MFERFQTGAKCCTALLNLKLKYAKIKKIGELGNQIRKKIVHFEISKTKAMRLN